VYSLFLVICACAAYHYLCLCRYYSKQWLDGGMGRVPPHKDKEVSKMRLSCFKKFFRSPRELAEVKEEYAKFSSCIEEFNDHDSIQDRWSSTPHSWWSNYGQDAPLLMSLAMKLLSQPTSSSCYERNWSILTIILFIVLKGMP
jgi:hypothetical protein